MAHGVGLQMKASRKDVVRLKFMALLTERAERAEIDVTIDRLTRDLAGEYDIPATYPPVG